MDSDIPKVRIFHVTVILYIWIQGSGTQGDRKCCKHVLSWNSKMAWDVSERSLSLEAVLVYTFALMVILIVLFASWINFGQRFVGSSGNEWRPNQQVMLVAVVAKYAGASMSSISTLPCMLSQWPAFVRRKRKKNQLHGELSAANLSSHFLLSSLNEYRLKARNNLQFKAHTTNHVVLCLLS